MASKSTLSQSDLVTFDGAVAGHDGVMSDASNSVVIKPCTAAEIAFYETARDFHPAFASYMPTFMGQLELASPEQAALLEATSSSAAGNDAGVVAAGGSAAPVPVVPQAVPSTDQKGKSISTNLSIVLSNATAPFLHPNILDVKLGSQLWDDTADISKRERLSKVASETTSGSLGFRIAGMRMWQPPHDDTGAGSYRDYGKLYGRAFKAENVREGFEEYLRVKTMPGLAKTVAKRFRDGVDGLRTMLEAEESRMIGASILLVYEGDSWVLERILDEEDEAAKAAQTASEDSGLSPVDGDRNDEFDEEEDDDFSDEDMKPISHNAKLIDFAHASFTPGRGPDENVLPGVRSVIKILDEIIAGDS